MTRKTRFPVLTAQEAHAALRWLHAAGAVTARQITDGLRKRDELVAEIRARIKELGGESERFLTAAAPQRRSARRRRRKPSAKAIAAWRRQGRYMAAMRRLPKAARAKVRAVRKAKGVATAIVAARKLRG